MPKKALTGDARAVLAAGAVLWRARRDGSDAVEVARRPPAPLRRLVAAQGQGRPRRDRAGHRGARDRGGDGLRGRAGPAARPSVELSGASTGTKTGAATGRRARSAASSPRTTKSTSCVWLPATDAMKRLQYPLDRKVLRRFTKQPADTRTVLIVRHGTRGHEVAVQGRRPEAPARQARTRAGRVTGRASCWRSAPPTSTPRPRARCHQTVEPLAEELGVTIRDEPALTEEAYADDRRRGRDAACWRSRSPTAHR